MSISESVGSTRSSTSSLAPMLILAVGTFAMGTDSFVLAGILPQISSGLDVSEASAGQVVTVFTLTYALTAPFLAAATAKIPRKGLLTVALIMFIVANAASAAAPNLELLLAARVLAALGAALFTPTASAAAVTLMGPERRGQALAIILGGLAVGTVFGVPAGTSLGQHLGWQASLLFITGVALVALAGLVLTLPALPAPPSVPMRQRLGVLVKPRVLLIIAITTIATAAAILVYTYISRILESTADISGGGLTLALLAWGVGGTIGNFGSGWLSDRYGANRTLLLAISVIGLTLLGLGYAGSLPLVMVLMWANGAGCWCIGTSNNHRLTGLAPTLPSVVISFNSSGIYLGQAVGAGFGGILLSHDFAVRELCIAGAVAAAIALGLHILSIFKIEAV